MTGRADFRDADSPDARHAGGAAVDERVLADLVAYVDGELTGDALARVERALEASPELRGRAAQHRAIGDWIRDGIAAPRAADESPADASSGAAEATLAAVHERLRRGTRSRALTMQAAAMFVGLAALGAVIWLAASGVPDGSDLGDVPTELVTPVDGGAGDVGAGDVGAGDGSTGDDAAVPAADAELLAELDVLEELHADFERAGLVAADGALDPQIVDLLLEEFAFESSSAGDETSPLDATLFERWLEEEITGESL